MPSGLFTEQVALDRFTGPALFRYRRTPAWEAWFQNRGTEWRIDCSGENLLAEYRSSLGVYDEGEAESKDDTARRLLLGTSGALKSALWMLERDPRFWTSPEEFEVSGGRMLYPPSPSMNEDWFETLDELSNLLSVRGAPCNLRDWGLAFEAARHHACAGENVYKRVLWRQDTDAPDLGTLAPLFHKLFGERVTRLGLKTWADFPCSLGPKLALQLTGMRVVILEGCDHLRWFPFTALMQWASQDRAEWWGWDKRRYWLPMPRLFVVAGRPLPVVDTLETELRQFLLPIGRGGKF